MVQIRARSFQGGVSDLRDHRRVRASGRIVASAMARESRPAWAASEMAKRKRLAFSRPRSLRGRTRGRVFRPRPHYRRSAAASYGSGNRHTISADRWRKRFGKIVTGARRPDPAADNARDRRIGRCLARRHHETERGPSRCDRIPGGGPVHGVAGTCAERLPGGRRACRQPAARRRRSGAADHGSPSQGRRSRASGTAQR